MTDRQILEKLYAGGAAPMPAQLLGPGLEPSEWRVRMLTGPVPDMGGWPLGHRKCLTLLPAAVGVGIAGTNVFRRDLRWGRFTLRWRPGAVELDYGLSADRLIRKIRDYVRTTSDPDVLVGKFYLLIRGRLRGGWFFTMTRIKSR